MDEVEFIKHICDGENDGYPWIIVGMKKNSAWFFLEAGCDYTGWDCRAGGDVQFADSYDNLMRYCVTENARGRFGVHVD